MIFSIPFIVIIQSSWFDISYSLQSTVTRNIRTLKTIGTVIETNKGPNTRTNVYLSIIYNMS